MYACICKGHAGLAMKGGNECSLVLAPRLVDQLLQAVRHVVGDLRHHDLLQSLQGVEELGGRAACRLGGDAVPHLQHFQAVLEPGKGAQWIVCSLHFLSRPSPECWKVRGNTQS
jgi:hypothetical protein